LSKGFIFTAGRKKKHSAREIIMVIVKNPYMRGGKCPIREIALWAA